jgi:hypothetical protein
MPNPTPELVASIGHDYQHNPDKSVPRIAVDHGVSLRTVYNLIEREGWLLRRDRRRDQRRDLPPPMRLLREATALLAARATTADVGPNQRSADQAAPPDQSAAIERVARLLERELAAEEAVRAQLGALPRPPADAERCARTLATLTQTLHALQRLRCGHALDPGADDDDDMPRDLDEFRRELARRIEAFLQSRPDEDDAEAGGEPALVEAVL